MEKKETKIIGEVEEPDLFETPEEFNKSVQESVEKKAQEKTAEYSRKTRSSKSKYSHKAVKKPKRTKRIIIAASIVAFVAILVGAGVAFANSFINTSFDDNDFETKEVLKTTEFNEPFYMVLVGTDTREKDGSYQLTEGRSDSCILVRIDPKTYNVTMISIPRDTKILYNGGTEKFNAAYNQGGIKDTISVINQIFNIEVSHYAEVSFNGLTDMVDAVGGVEVNVPQAITDEKVDVNVPAGQQTLNGIQALSFSRSRNFGDGDFTRAANQRVLIQALIQKAFKLPIGDLPNLLQVAKKYIKTDFTIKDMYSLAMLFRDAEKLTMYSAMVPSTTGGEGGVSYCYTDKDALKRMMMMVENGEDPVMVEITTGASVAPARDQNELNAQRTQYYKDHPESPGKATSSSPTYVSTEPANTPIGSGGYSSNYDDSYSNGYDNSGYSNSSSSSNSYNSSGSTSSSGGYSGGSSRGY